MSDNQLKDLFVIGINHDIGYQFSDNGSKHNVIGGEILRNCGFKYWQEVYYHGEINSQYSSLYLTILNQADMQVDKYGNDVGYDMRLDDIRGRYGENSIVYSKCLKLVENIRNKY